MLPPNAPRYIPRPPIPQLLPFFFRGPTPAPANNNRPLFFQGKPALFRVQTQAVAGGRLALIPLLPTGEFWREDLGQFKVTRQDLSQVMRNAQSRSDLMQIDYNHNAFKAAGEVPNGDGVKEKRAAGWIDRRSLFVCPWNGGYCLMGWGQLTAEAAQRREAGELLYISPALERARQEIGRPGYPAGAPIGLSILNVALCDIPFFDMPAVSLFNRWAQTQRRAVIFGGQVMDQLKALIATILGQAGLAADLVAPMVDALIQAFTEYMQSMGGGAPAQADPAAAAAAMGALPPQQAAFAQPPAAAAFAQPQAQPAFALASLLGQMMGQPQQAAPAQYPGLFSQQPQPQYQQFAITLPDGRQVLAPAQVAPPAQPTYPGFFAAQPPAQPAQPQHNPILFLFGLLQARQAAQAQQAQAQQAQQGLAFFQQAEAQGRNAYMQAAGVPAQQFAAAAPQVYQQAVNAGPVFAGPLAFSPAPQAFTQPLANPAMGQLFNFAADKPTLLRRKVDEYHTKQSQAGRKLTYTAAMNEARNLRLLDGLE